MILKKYPIVRQEVDVRDKLISASLSPNANVKLPKMVDLREKSPVMFDQGQENSCTANSGTLALMWQYPGCKILSRQFLYANERIEEGDIDKDQGAQMRTVCKAIQKYGVCEEIYFPYFTTNVFQTPPKSAYDNAKNHTISSYRAVNGLDEIKMTLALKQQPVMIAIDVFTSFESAIVAKTGVVPMPKRGEKNLGGHDVSIVMYDDKKKILILQNSWGSSWGMKGFFSLPYSFVEKGFAFDSWVLTK